MCLVLLVQEQSGFVRVLHLCSSLLRFVDSSHLCHDGGPIYCGEQTIQISRPRLHSSSANSARISLDTGPSFLASSSAWLANVWLSNLFVWLKYFDSHWGNVFVIPGFVAYSEDEDIVFASRWV